MLQSLTLGDRLYQEDMESLSLASKEDKLPNLRHLFIHNGPDALHLFTGREKWNQLLTLRVDGSNVLDLGFECLASLQNLEINLPGRRDLKIKRCWPCLQTIKSSSKELLSEVAEGVEKSLLPALKTVRDASLYKSAPYFKFYKANIRCITPYKVTK